MTFPNGRWLVRLTLIIGCLSGFLAVPGTIRAESVDLELVLAVDVSSSVDPYEAAVQRRGYVEAIRHPFVVNAIQAGPTGRIAVTYVEWAGEFYQHVVVDWTIVSDQVSAEALSETLTDRPITTAPSTSISGLLDFARKQILTNSHDGTRAVIDVSGDGPNSTGRPVRAARDAAIAAGITINGLPVFIDRTNPDGSGPATGLMWHYFNNVIGGPGAFVMGVSEFKNFLPTLIEKLEREIRGPYAISMTRPPN